MDKETEHRLTKIETNLEQIVDNVKELSDGCVEFKDIINQHVVDDLKDHTEYQTDLIKTHNLIKELADAQLRDSKKLNDVTVKQQKNTNFRKKIMWWGAGAGFVVVLIWFVLELILPMIAS